MTTLLASAALTSSFVELQFPPGISYGAIGGPGFNTTVITMSSGLESRNQNWLTQRAVYDVAQGLKTQVELNQLLSFFVARRGKAQGFRFKDWADYKCPYYITTPGDVDAIPTLFTTDGVTTTFQLVKPYVDLGGNVFYRNIYKPVAGSLVLYNNAVATTDFAVDTTTGLVTLGSDIAATTGHTISGSYQFDIPVRFDTDQMKTTIADYNNFTWNQIPIIELKLE